MPALVPASLEARLRQKAARRAKLKGYGIIAAYVVGVGAMFWSSNTSFIWIILWTSGFAVALRHVRAARLLAEDVDPIFIGDDDTRALVEKYRDEIHRSGQREVAAGALSTAVPTTEGELSFAKPAGEVSIVDPSDGSRGPS